MQQYSGPSTSGSGTWSWTFPQLISSQQRHLQNYAILVLNRPITQGESFFRDFWNDASVRVTVDGGTKKYDDFVSKLPGNIIMQPPDLITGDFDSITNIILEKYKRKGCQIIHTPDQNHTDFTKALMELYKYCQEYRIEIEHVVVLSQNSGRLDQILGNIQTLFLANEKHLLQPSTRIYLMSDDSISWILQPGNHVINIPKETLKHKKSWCSLVPVGEPCKKATTTGLKWNLDDQCLQFGELVSTSNTFDGSDQVTVTVSHNILWSMRVPQVNQES